MLDALFLIFNFTDEGGTLPHFSRNKTLTKQLIISVNTSLSLKDILNFIKVNDLMIRKI